MLNDEDVDFCQELLVDQANIVADGAVVKCQGGAEGGQPHDFAHETVEVGDVLHAVIIAVESEADHAQHQNMPKIHPRAPGAGGFGALEFVFEQLENGFVQPRRAEDPLEAGEDGREFIAAFEGDDDLIDRGLAEICLRLESFAHGITNMRMSRVSSG